MDFTARKLELTKESEELQKQLGGLENQKNQLIQRALEAKGAYNELIRLEKESEPTTGG